jgi:FdhD protein
MDRHATGGHRDGGRADRLWGAPREPDRIAEVAVHRYDGDASRLALDEVAVEEPLALEIAGRRLAIIMRTPGHDAALAAGFLLSEGLIESADDLLGVAPAADRDGFPQPNALALRLRPALEDDQRLTGRPFPVTASCGICGTASLATWQVSDRRLPLGDSVAAAVVTGLEPRLRAAQAVFSRTGGLHAAGLFDFAGRLVVLHEDVGRHNAVDKVIGEQLLARRLPLAGHLLLVSGRTSFELVQKAAIAGIPILAAVGAPTSLAVELARVAGVTLIGMLRAARFVVYAWPERIH